MPFFFFFLFLRGLSLSQGCCVSKKYLIFWGERLLPHPVQIKSLSNTRRQYTKVPPGKWHEGICAFVSLGARLGGGGEDGTTAE